MNCFYIPHYLQVSDNFESIWVPTEYSKFCFVQSNFRGLPISIVFINLEKIPESEIFEQSRNMETGIK